MKIFDLELLMKGKVAECLLVSSYQEYKDLGGTRDQFDVYSINKERAKKYELNYIQGNDMALSGIPVDENLIQKNRLLAQIHWYILHKWFNKPLRVVRFRDFDLKEFNKL